MYEDYPQDGEYPHRVIPPENPDQMIWRYLSFPKYVDMLRRSGFFFSTVEALRDSDPYEGAMTQIEIEKLREHEERFREIQKTTGGQLPDALSPVKGKERIWDTWKRTTIVNCWHMNDEETASMWRIYAAGGEGVAIQSTYGRLRQSFVDTKLPDPTDELQEVDFNVHIGMIDYLNYDISEILTGDIHHQFMRKPLFYADERELRVIAVLDYFLGAPTSGKAIAFYEEFKRAKGLVVGVSLSQLIERVVVSPTSSTDWYLDLVRDVSHRYGFNFCIEKSRLRQIPSISA